MTNLVAFSLLTLISAVSAETLTLTHSDIAYIYDADTFFIRCRTVYRCKNNKLGIRVMGVDSAEIKGRCKKEILLAREAKQFAVGKLRAAKSIVLVVNSKRRYDRWGRLLAWVKLDGYDLAEMLIAANLGRVYHGSKRKGWCE